MEVSTWEAGEPAPQRLCALDTRDAASGGAPKRQPLAQHVAAARDDLRALPQTQSSVRLQVDVAAEGASRRAVWLVAESLGGGRAREMCGDELVLAHGLQPLPWAGVAARLHGGDTAVSGRPYCLLPLPTETGLPVHINGFFELSSNRRDIWYGDDLIGGGKLRSEWNVALLEDVVAPTYVRLLLEARDLLEGSAEDFYGLWPGTRHAEPWGRLAAAVHRQLLRQPVLPSELGGGTWVAPDAAVFCGEWAAADDAAVRAVLLRAGMPLVAAPAGVRDGLRAAAAAEGVTLRVAGAAEVRSWLGSHGGWSEELTLEEGDAVLRLCVGDLVAGGFGSLHGLPLLPLASGGWGTIGAASAPPLLVCAARHRPLLRPNLGLLIDVDADGECGRALQRVAASGETNVATFSASLVGRLLPQLLPSEWRGRELVALDAAAPAAAEAEAEGGGDGEGEGGGAGAQLLWCLRLWRLLGEEHATVDLRELEGWPLLPTAGGEAYALPAGGLGGSRVIDLAAVSDALVRGALSGAGCVALHPRASRAHPGLKAYVHEPSALAALLALRAAAGGDAAAVPARFGDVGRAERRALAAMLAERRHVEEEALRFSDGNLVELLLSLPIFDVHGGSDGDAPRLHWAEREGALARAGRDR